MKRKPEKINPVPEINVMLQSIDGEAENRIDGIFLNEILSPFFKLHEEIIIPSIPVKELSYKQALSFLPSVIAAIPLYLEGHILLEERKPVSEQHSLHFIRAVEGKVIDFVHVLRLDFRFSADSGTIIEMGTPSAYPSYKTDRIYYHSRIVPVIKGSISENIDSFRIKESLNIQADLKLFTSVVFDDQNSRETSSEFSKTAGEYLFPLPINIYQFIVYDYFSACLNLPDPGKKIISRASELFEPLFVFINGALNGIDHIDEKWIEVFSHCLYIEEQKILMTESFISAAIDFFGRYSIFRDDELMSQSLRMIKVDNDGGDII